MFYSFVPEWGWMLAHAALAPLWVSLIRGTCRPSGIIAFGAVFACLYFFWLWVFSPLAPVFMTILHTFWLATPLFICLIPPLRRNPWMLMLTGSGLWVLSEFCRSLGPYGYEWGGLGYSQYGSLRMAAWASAGGVAILSGVTLVSNALLAWAWHKKDFRWAAACVVWIFGVAIVSPYPRLSADCSPADEFSLLQTNVSPYAKSPERDEFLKAQLDVLGARAQAGSSSCLVLPETLFSRSIVGSRGYLLEEPRFLLSPVLPRKAERYLLVGAIEEDDRGFYNAAILIDAEGRRVSAYRKRHLVPFGESIPGLEDNGAARALGQLLGTPFFAAGDTAGSIRIGERLVGVLICFEGTFTHLVAESALGSDLLLNISNDAWSESEFGHEQHLRFLRFRAVETGLPILRVGNSGPTAVFAPNGELVHRIPHSGPDVLDLTAAF